MSDNRPSDSVPDPSTGSSGAAGGTPPQQPATPQQPAAPQQPAGGAAATPPPPPPPPVGAPGGQTAPANVPGGQPTGIGAAVNWAIKKFGENWTVLVGFALLIAITQGISFAFSSANNESGVVDFIDFVLSIVLAIVGIILTISLVRAALKISRGEKAEWSDLWNPTHFWQYVGVSIVIGLLYVLVTIVGIGGIGVGVGVGGFLAGAIGTILALGALVAGVLIWWLMQFSQYSVINEGKGVGAALSESVNLVKANKGESVLTLVVLVVASLLGAITCGIGTLVTMPIAILFMAHMYRQFRGEHEQIAA